jgi:hypothetical protein
MEPALSATLSETCEESPHAVNVSAATAMQKPARAVTPPFLFSNINIPPDIVGKALWRCHVIINLR